MLLDTNALSDWAEQKPTLLAILRADRPWYISSISLGEYRFGVLASTRRPALEHWLGEIEKICEILSPDAETARHYASIRSNLLTAGHQISYHDIWIGALAIQHGLPVVTRDAHFDRITSLRRIGW